MAKKFLINCSVHRRDFEPMNGAICPECYKRTFEKAEELEAVIQTKNEIISKLRGRIEEMKAKGKKK